MTTHDTYLRLAAIAVDEPLGAADRTRLGRHIAECQACARAVAGYRADAAAIAALPHATLDERRGAAILDVVLQQPARRVSPTWLMVAAALLALALLGSLWVGSELLRRASDEQISVVIPVPSVTASPGGSPLPSAVPSASPPVVVPVLPGTLAVTSLVQGSDGSSTSWIAVVTADGRVTRLVPGRDPAWLSATRIVYTCGDPLAGSEAVCVVDPGAPEAGLTLVVDAGRPVPASDGTVIAVQRGTIDVGETWLMTAEGHDLRRIAAGDFTRWSPDGAWLAGQPASAGPEIAIVRPDGTGLRTFGPGYDPAWSPTGDRIVYAVVDGERSLLREVHVATGEIEDLYTAPVGTELVAPEWLPDGSLVFVLDGNLQLLPAGEPIPVPLTAGREIAVGTIGERTTVSPDGAWVAVTDSPASGQHVIAIDVRAQTELEVPESDLLQPRWAPAAPVTPAEPTAPPAGAPLGTTWSDATEPVVAGRPIGRIEAVTAGGPGFVAVGRGCLMQGGDGTCEGIVWLSTDGRTWDRAPAQPALDLGFSIPTSGPEMGMFDVVAGGPGIVAVGYSDRARMEATAWFSSDGGSWRRIVLGRADRYRVSAVTWTGEAFVVVGGDRSAWDGSYKSLAGATARAAVWTSIDGVTWSRVPHTAALDAGGFIDTMEDPATGGMADVVAGPGGLAAVGSECADNPRRCVPAAWISPDGTAWERVANLPAVEGELAAVTTRGAGYVAVGRLDCNTGGGNSGGACPALVMTSGVGRTWTLESFGQDGDLASILWIGDRLYATAPDGPVTLWTSLEGAAWSPAEVTGGPSTGAGSSPSAWHLAASADAAVWLGLPSEDGDPVAWVSPAR